MLLLACVFAFSFNGYANGDDLQNTDPSQPLEGCISSCIKDVQEKLWMAQLEFEQEERKFDENDFSGSYFEGTVYTPSPKISRKTHLAHDQKSLATAKVTLGWIAKKNGKYQKKIKDKRC